MAKTILVTDFQHIYLDQITLVLKRLEICERFLKEYNKAKELPILESAILQMRKAMECVAFAAVAPNKDAYVSYRKDSEKNPDYTKDFNARAIFQYLSKINPNFYPEPVLEPRLISPGNCHFGRPSEHPLSQNKFEDFYDRLGKFLHSDNPWAQSKGMSNLLKNLPEIIRDLRAQLAWHFTTIKTPQFSGVWVVKAFSDGSVPVIITGQTTDDFIVT